MIMARVVLGTTGSVAALKTPEVVRLLRGRGHEVRVIATARALHFFDPSDFDDPTVELLRDEQEWPEERYQRGDPIPHILWRDWGDLLMVAPLDAQTLARFALGLCDNALACIYRAWLPERPVLLAPAMNTAMWRHPVTCRHLAMIARDLADDPNDPDAIPRFHLEDAAVTIHRHVRRLTLAAPIVKTLACGDHGVGAMAEPTDLVEWVEFALRRAGHPTTTHHATPTNDNHPPLAT